MRHPAAERPEVSVRPSRLRDIRLRDILLRFVFGAAVSAVAGAVSLVWGPRAGGLFLAFPAILLAALTLVAKEEGLPSARDDARGAAIGSVGMLAFAIVCALVARHDGGLAALGAATAAWAFVSIGGYLLVRRMGFGADEPAPGDSGPSSRT
ncbi:MAG: hypothetical protein JWR24_2594 [Actinoallomurus sp.]|nr:hypothetical protein [Actinoallomurus sp.]